ncbi:MAG: hypothetical protein IJS52_04200, partial [Bacilli bacterium]|nr:hypothetical protein [Bacilli bacterium]
MQEKLSPIWKIETILEAYEIQAILMRFSIMADMNLLELTLKPVEERTSSSDSWYTHDDLHLRDDVEARLRFGPIDAHRHRPKSILGRREAILSIGRIPLDCDDCEKMYNRKKGESIMKKTLLLAATAVVGASIVAIAGLNAGPSLLSTDVKAGTSEKNFAFNASNASIFSGAFEGDEHGGQAFVPEIETNQGTPLQGSSLTVYDEKSHAFGENGRFFECETD